MSSQLKPWRAFQSLSIRGRPLVLSWRGAEQQARPALLPFCVARRRFRTESNNSNDGHGDEYASKPPSPTPPPPPPPGADSQFESPLRIMADPPRPVEMFAPNYLNAEALAKLQAIADHQELEDEESGHKFGIPAISPRDDRLQNRYPAIITQVTRLLMRDGKLGVAQTNMAWILNYLRTAPAPKASPTALLLPGAPPLDKLPLDPIAYLTLAIDSVAPVLRIQSLKDLGGGGTALDVPQPLVARQRRRTAVQWILDAVEKRPSKGSGRKMFAYRVAEEIVAIVEGRSPVWMRRMAVHKLATVARANLNHPKVAGRRRPGAL